MVRPMKREIKYWELWCS